MNKDPSSILIAIPAYDGRIDFRLMSGISECLGQFAKVYMAVGVSSPSLARNEIAHHFMENTEFEWLMCIDSDTAFHRTDWDLLWEGDEEVVIAEYARKLLGEKPVQFGCGFCRIHRSVFERIKELKNDDGQDRVPRFYLKGRMMVDYYPDGALTMGRWIGEDQGFFMWAGEVKSSLRMETRTHLGHVGYFVYGYPEQIPGWEPVSDGSN